ncbi:E3 ubiquitin-protein ligase At4g11680 [Linum perenne]
MSTDAAPSTPSRAGSSSSDIIDSTPLLSPGSQSDTNNTSNRRSIRRQSLRDAARFIRRASGRRMMREPSMMVRETAAEQLEERQSDWAYSKPVVVLDIIWNFAFVAAAIAVLLMSGEERPNMPLRLWIVGYGMQCLLHMGCVVVEYRRRRRRRLGFEPVAAGRSDGNSSSGSRGDSGDFVTLSPLQDDEISIAKHLESANTMFSFIWWIIGFYWVSAGGEDLSQDSPQLYWLCIVFLGFDVFFVVFCVALACVIGIAEGATKEDIDQLTKFKFRRVAESEKLAGEEQETPGGIMTECGTDSPIEHALPQEDAECCICLSAYDDGVEIRELPCAHHFHCSCVDKWLHLNATCPLCKYNILKSSRQDVEEV